MSLVRAKKFILNHDAYVEFPSEELATSFLPHAALIRSAGSNVAQIYRRCVQEEESIERCLIRQVHTINNPDPFLAWCMRALFAAKFTEQHAKAENGNNSFSVQRLHVLTQRFMVQCLLFADQSIHSELIGSANSLYIINQDSWECGMAGARAVMQVLVHMARPNRLFFFPRIDEDTQWKIDLIILEVTGNGICCQVKGTKSIDGEIHITELKEPPNDDYLSRFYYGTQQFNYRYGLSLQPVVFTVGW